MATVSGQKLFTCFTLFLELISPYIFLKENGKIRFLFYTAPFSQQVGVVSYENTIQSR